MKNSPAPISFALTLFTSVALPFLASAQAPAPNSPAADAAKVQQDSADVRRAQQENDRGNERALDDAQIRLNAERKLKVHDAPKDDQAALDPPHQLLARLFQLPAKLKLSPESRALAEATLQPLRERAAAAWPAWQERATARDIAASGKKAADVNR